MEYLINDKAYLNNKIPQTIIARTIKYFEQIEKLKQKFLEEDMTDIKKCPYCKECF